MKPMLAPTSAIALVRTMSRVKSANKAVTAADTAPAPWSARPTNKPCMLSAKAAQRLPTAKTNKPKKTEWVQDYFLQLAAYAMAHNELYNTNIQQGVILMCSATYEPQHWVVSGLEFQRYCDDWCQRVEQFYK